MVINGGEEFEQHVKFISYSGTYPALCRGALIVEIDGKRVKFGHDSFNNNSSKESLPCFWKSGGLCHYWDDSGLIEYGDWEIDYEKIPDEYKKYAKEFDYVINANVKKGCCGGCKEEYETEMYGDEDDDEYAKRIKEIELERIHDKVFKVKPDRVMTVRDIKTRHSNQDIIVLVRKGDTEEDDCIIHYTKGRFFNEYDNCEVTLYQDDFYTRSIAVWINPDSRIGELF